MWMQRNRERTYWQCLTVHAGSPRHVPFRCTTNTCDPQRTRLSPPQIQRERHRNLAGTHRHRIIHPPSVAITIQEYLGAPKHARHTLYLRSSPWRHLCTIQEYLGAPKHARHFIYGQALGVVYVLSKSTTARQNTRVTLR